MLIIVENDYTGTVAEQLAAEIRRMHPGDSVSMLRPDPNETSWERFVAPLVDYRPRPRLERIGLRGWRETSLRHIVCDGWNWSAWVDDAETENTRSALTPGVMGYLDRFLRSRGAFVVRMMDDRDPTVHGYDGLRRDHLFNKLTKPSYVPWIARYGADTESMGSLAARGQTVANTGFIMRSMITYTGPPNPDALLLGNARDLREHASYPSFMPYAGSPGEFLSDALAGFMSTSYDGHGSSVGVANACDGDSLEHLIEYLNPLVVVPLGNSALRAYEKLSYAMTHDIRVFPMRHPSVARNDARLGDYASRVDAYTDNLRHGLYY